MGFSEKLGVFWICCFNTEIVQVLIILVRTRKFSWLMIYTYTDRSSSQWFRLGKNHRSIFSLGCSKNRNRWRDSIFWSRSDQNCRYFPCWRKEALTYVYIIYTTIIMIITIIIHVYIYTVYIYMYCMIYIYPQTSPQRSVFLSMPRQVCQAVSSHSHRARGTTGTTARVKKTRTYVL